MITHVVMMKFKADAPEDTPQKVREHLLGLGELDMVQKWEVGLNVGASTSANDLVVYSTFDSLDAVAEFRVHPKHVEAKEFMKPFLEKSGTVDYES